jgi:hypothetical protein
MYYAPTYQFLDWTKDQKLMKKVPGTQLLTIRLGVWITQEPIQPWATHRTHP